MKGNSDGYFGSGDLNKENQELPPALPYLGPQAATPFDHDGFALPPPASTGSETVAVSMPMDAAMTTPVPSHTEVLFPMKTIFACILGTIYLYFHQYGDCE